MDMTVRKRPETTVDVFGFLGGIVLTPANLMARRASSWTAVRLYSNGSRAAMSFEQRITAAYWDDLRSEAAR